MGFILARGTMFNPLMGSIRSIASASSTTSTAAQMPSVMDTLRDLPRRPKKPASPWNRFTREKMVGTQGNATKNIKSIANEWKNASSDVRAKYQEAYNREQVGYLEQMDEYNKIMKRKVTIGQVATILSESGKAKVTKVKQPQKKSGYNVFVSQHASSNLQADGKIDLASLGRQWRSLSENERELYNQKARDLK